MEIREIQDGRDAWFSRRKRFQRKLLKPFRELGVVDAVHLDELPYPHYAYGVLVACMQARMLAHDRITVIEFGVAGGNGLLALEHLAQSIGQSVGVAVDVIGFDGGEGMPPSNDPRDMVYWFRPTAYKMNVPELLSRLSTARLEVGLIENTVARATENLEGPIGFCSFDMDYYSATTAALKIFDAAPSTRLPRVLLYADDIFGYHDLNIMGSDVGEEKAFADFNENHPQQRIARVAGLRHKRPVPAMWNDKMFALHDLTHPEYNTSINPANAREREELLALRDD